MGVVIPFPKRPSEQLIGKRQLARALGRSTRWVELRQRDDGLPFHRDPESGYCRYRLSEVLAWKERAA